MTVGANMMGGHHVQSNGDMNGAHTGQSMVSTSHCTPPPPYNPDPSLVRYFTLQQHGFTHSHTHTHRWLTAKVWESHTVNTFKRLFCVPLIPFDISEDCALVCITVHTYLSFAFSAGQKIRVCSYEIIWNEIILYTVYLTIYIWTMYTCMILKYCVTDVSFQYGGVKK